MVGYSAASNILWTIFIMDDDIYRGIYNFSVNPFVVVFRSSNVSLRFLRICFDGYTIIYMIYYISYII